MLKLATWTSDEFVMILLGQDFRYFNWRGAQLWLKKSKFAERFLDLQEIVGRAFHAGQIPERGPPDRFVLWAWERGVGMPEELRQYAVRLIATDANRIKEQRAKALQAEYIANLKMLVAELSAEVDWLRSQCNTLRLSSASEVEQLNIRREEQINHLVAFFVEAQSDFATVKEENRILRDENNWLWESCLRDAPAQSTEQPEVAHEVETQLDPRRERSRDRIALGLAMKFCDFDPRSQKSGTCRRVADALAEFGIKITERTVGPTLKSIHAELASAGAFSPKQAVFKRK